MNIAKGSAPVGSIDSIAQFAEWVEKIHVNRMNEECRFCIAIPCYYQELGVKNALSQYKKLAGDKKNFEIVLLLNAPSHNQIENSEAKKQIDEFTKENPGFPIQVYSVTVPFQVKGKIGRLRWILTKLNMDRCLEANVPISEMIHITHDADLVDVPPEYLNKIQWYFQKNPNVQIVWGHVEYPEWFKGKYYLGFILQRVEDAFSIVWAHRNKTSVKSGNAIYRLENLLSNPFRDAKKWEASTVVNATRKKFADLGIGVGEVVRHANNHQIPAIVSDPRRIVLSIENNSSDGFSRRHEKFAQEGDLMFQYVQNITDPDSINDGVEYSNQVTKEQIASGIEWLLLGRLSHVYRSTKLPENEKQGIIHRMRKDLAKACFLSCGIRISIDDENKVTIDDMSRLQKNLLEKYGPLKYTQNR